MSSNLTDQIIPFDASNFIDVREKALTTNLRCSKITPLLTTSGCLVVTNSYIYFQPCTSAILSAQNTTATIAPKATPWALSSISGYGRRYSGLKDSALELFLSDNNTNSSVLLAFETPEDRERVLRLLPTHVPCHTDREFVVACCNQWVSDATLSNYDYLLALNSAAARSFHDLSRYPVFPWVIKDYKSTKLDLTKPSTFRDLSKPVGALDENRLEYFQTRFESMQQDMTHPFLYGTHYSAPGYVLYYLVRSMPEHMLCLQNGTVILFVFSLIRLLMLMLIAMCMCVCVCVFFFKGKFDSPDRMFHSLEHSYASVLTNHADVKGKHEEDKCFSFSYLYHVKIVV
jgi:factor associated with neutral sphingomyelinase activation